ncbi:response regulator transcription factor [Spirosoma sp. BT702]|uniref:Response regulator transcription factor n=1 Tax=Spirosoma profusum TaxID=2771354 RepID=A0A926XW63_9BACT|nr:response regulator transcription factor [Spirosoma profusum]MBD2701813.1 response regulator transcription factor [Spirosoma profusum]
MKKISLAIVDNHQLVAQALSKLLARFDEYSVLFEAANGKEMINYVQAGRIPDIVLLDVNMPEMNGFETATWLKNNVPTTKILALSVNDKVESIIGMLRNGATGYLLKDSRPSAIKAALDDLVEKGYHYTDFVANCLVKNLQLEESGVL